MDIKVVRGENLSDAERKSIISLCSRAYKQEMGTLFDTFVEPTHVLGFDAGSLVSHALWVTRQFQIGTLPLMRTAYVEAVATEEAFRKRGFAAAILKRLVAEVQDYDLAALSPFDEAYYERLGWEPWRGLLFIRTNDRIFISPPDERVMIMRLPRTPDLDLHELLSAEWRPGEWW